MKRKDWPVTLRRWTSIWDRRQHPTASLGIAQCLREMGRYDEAEQILAEALKRPRQDAIACWTEMALIAEGRGDWAEAAVRWEDVRKRAPSTLDAYCRGALALGKCDREAEVEPILHEATQRFASEAQPWIDYARAAERRGSTDEAEERWEQVRLKFPNEQAATRRTRLTTQG